MTVLKITVADEQAELLKELLKGVIYVKSIEEEPESEGQIIPIANSPYERLKKIQQSIGDKKLFKEIEDPSEWQREIRKEWDRDF